MNNKDKDTPTSFMDIHARRLEPSVITLWSQASVSMNAPAKQCPLIAATVGTVGHNVEQSRKKWQLDTNLETAVGGQKPVQQRLIMWNALQSFPPRTLTTQRYAQ
jgi:hypothetical protein